MFWILALPSAITFSFLVVYLSGPKLTSNDKLTKTYEDDQFDEPLMSEISKYIKDRDRGYKSISVSKEIKQILEVSLNIIKKHKMNIKLGWRLGGDGNYIVLIADKYKVAFNSGLYNPTYVVYDGTLEYSAWTTGDIKMLLENLIVGEIES